jgi:uncharacterized membrane protein (UPF0136 family)
MCFGTEGRIFSKIISVRVCCLSATMRESNLKFMTATIVLWVYIALLLAGGVMGWARAGSKVSLIMSLIFAAALALFAAGIVQLRFGADFLLAVLLAVFVARYAKTKKFMPAGLMVLLTAAALLIRLIV